MIKIDLGKDGLTSVGKGGRKNLFGKIPLPDGFGSKFDFSVSFLSLIGLALVLAILPQPFLKRYKVMVKKDHDQQMQALQQQVRAHDKQIEVLIPYESELESYKKQRKAVSDRLGIVQQLLSARKTPVTILDTVAQNLPRRTWLDEIKAGFSEGEAVSIKGRSYANEEISDYIDKLTDSVYLKNVDLISVRTEKMGETINVRKFEIQARSKVDSNR